MKKLKQQFSEGITLIPDDLLVEIFSLLPRKSIARFRCVSKFLASILSRHDFTELFLTKSLTRPLLLFTTRDNGNGKLFYSAPQPHNPDDNSSLVATPYHPRLALDPSNISKPVSGLVLFHGWGGRTGPLIGNPATGKIRALPIVPTEENDIRQGIHLGYDPIGKQFKVLCLRLKHSIYNTHWILTVECLWRKLEPEFSFKANGDINSDVCINGVLYLEGMMEEGSSVIVCFDVRSEKFSYINKDEDMRPPTSCLTLFNYRGKLGIHCQFEQKLVLWVVEDAGNHKWSKRNIQLSHCFKEMKKNAFSWTIVGMTGAGEIVFSPCHSCVFFYNIERKTFRRVDIQGLEGHWHISLDYVENLKSM